MNNPIDTILSVVPQQYRQWVALAFMASPYITRTVYALMNGRGLKGVLSAIWLGTNTPKQLPAVMVTTSAPLPTATTGTTSITVTPSHE